MNERIRLFMFMSVGRKNIPELHPQRGLLCIHQTIYEYGELWWNDIDSKKPMSMETSLSQCHFLHHESHMD
jgi:hypothetical protein